ncbi:Ig-like domain-containing protein [Taibaiella soli]|uniref:Ig-like domain-containing protein n=1 Tax=Taibaiella soli TaxID=1649169 RepID=A0A2W2AFK9_9BACT|nr:T9SS type A sorting domain-containing protein [Taibaiella soli]PZF70990.1 hypothetical protein DN068_19990 [Taibaiella soli]
MNKKLIGVLLFIFQLCTYRTEAQLSGNISVPGTSYNTLNDVISALNAQGVGSGGVAINILPGNPQYAPSGGYRLGSTILNNSLQSSASLTINGNNNTVTSNVGNGGSDGIFSILGADYVTINALNLLDTNTVSNTTEMEWGYGMVKLNSAAPFDGCQYNTIRNCNITLNRTCGGVPGTSAGSSFGGSKGVMLLNISLTAPTSLLTITSPLDAHNNNIVKGCNIQNCNIGIYDYGYNGSPGLYDQNNVFGGDGVNDGNTITNFGGNAVFESAGIYINGYANNTYIRGNTINNMQNGGTPALAAIDGIYHGLATGSSITVRKNNISLTEGAASGSIQGVVLNCGGVNENEIDIDTNTVNILYNGTALNSGTTNGYSLNSSAVVTNLSCTGNRVSISSAANGTVFGFSFGSGSIGNSPRWTINDNVVDSIIRTAANTSGNTAGISQSGLLTNSALFECRRNNVKKMSVPYYTSVTVLMYGISVSGGTAPLPVRTITNNTVTNITAGAAQVYGMDLGYNGVGSTISNNTVTNMVDSGGLVGIRMSTGTTVGTACFNNTVSNLKNIAVGAASGSSFTTYGMYFALGSTGSIDLYSNNINNVQTNVSIASASPGVFVAGMYFASGVAQNCYNNIISDLRAPFANGFSPVYGMYVNSGANYNLYHNTINIGPGFMPISGGANFGATGLYLAYGIPVDLRNNIIRINASPRGNGVVSAVRTSFGYANVRPTGLKTTSNGNIYWAPSDASIFIYCEGATLAGLMNAFNYANDPTFNTGCSRYKALMYPAETGTFFEDNLSQVGVTPVYAPTGTSLAKKNAVPTAAPTVTTDYNGITRPTPADAGALQFSGTPAGDFIPPAIAYTPIAGKTYCLSAPTLTATIADSSGVNTTTNPPRLYYKKASEADTFGVYPGNNIASFNGWKYVAGANTGGNNFSFAIDYAKLTSTISGGDSILYFVVAQDNNAIPNVGISVATLDSGYCPASVNLTPDAGPTAGITKKNGYFIMPQPALPGVIPANASVCQGTSTRLTAVPTSNPKLGTIGTLAMNNSTGGYPTPFGNLYGANHEQYLVLASELTAQGLTYGNISSLAFNMYAAYPAANAALNNFNIQMANTGVSSFPGATYITSGFTAVYSGSYTPPANTGWATINFATPFYWDGASNVVVDVSFTNCTTCNNTSSCVTTTSPGNGQIYQTPTSFTSVVMAHGSNNCTIGSFNPNGGSGLSFSTSSNRPDMQFMGTQAFRVNWVPTTGLFKDSLMTSPLSATDTNTVVFAGPATNSSYSVTNVLGACNSIPGIATPVTLNAAPAVSTTPANTASFCGGSNVTISGATGSNYTYQWLNGTTPINGATNNTYTATTTGNYTFKATNGNGCSGTATVAVTNTQPPVATVLANNTTFCQGDSAMLTANAGTGYTYQWLQNGTPIAGATHIQYAAKTAGNYTVNVYNAANCFGTSQPVSVAVNPLNVAVTPSGSLAFCTGSNVILSITSPANQTYQWMNNGVNIPGETNASYTAIATGNYSVAVVNTVSGCTGTSAVQVVTVGNGPIANITAAGPTSVCTGNTVTLNTTPATGVTYEWLQNGTIISGATGTSYAANATGSYSLRVYSNATCFTTSSPIAVTINQLPNVITTPAGGVATYCQNGSTILSVPSNSNQTYQWTFNGNPINGATNYNYSASAVGAYAVSVVNSQTGCTDTSANITLSQVPAPAAPVITGNALICGGDSSLMTTTAVSGVTYQWRLGSGNINGATNTSYEAKTAGAYTIVASNAAGCAAISNAITLAVNAAPNVTTTPATGNATYCQNSSLTLSVQTGNNQTYQWYNGNTAISGATNTQYSAAAAGSYHVVVTNSQTSCSATSGNIVLSMVPKPTASITGGPSAVCAGDSATLMANAGNGFSYQWLNATGAIPGANAQTFYATFTGNFRAVVKDANSCTDTSNAIALTIYSKPGAIIVGPHAICAGDTATLQASTGAGYTYIWKSNGNTIPGATSSIYKTNVAGSYSVKITSSQNCSTDAYPLAISVNALPTPTITQNQATLSTTTAYSAYQWYFNNTPINGAVGMNYTATQLGNYYVVVTDANGCSNKSNTINVTTLDVKQIAAGNTTIHIYPNPTSDLVNIEAPVSVNVVVRDLSGKQLKDVKNVKQVNMGDLADGVYMMAIYDEQNTLISVEKVFKSK